MPFGLIRVDQKGLAEALLLPENYHIFIAQQHPGEREIKLIVQSVDIPNVADGKPFPEVTPIYNKDEQGNAQLVRIDIRAE